MSSILEPVKDLRIQHTQLFINNEWVEAKDNSSFPTFNPTTTKEICRVSEAKQADVEAAVTAARAAFDLGSPWRTMSYTKRAEMLNKLADLIERDRQQLATLETLDNGKIYSRVYTSDLQTVINVFRYFAGWIDKLHGNTLPVDGDMFAYTKHEPIGVCGAIVPWNVPLIMLAWKTAPCLAAGNTLVLKPAEETPLTALYIASLFKEAGFPPGVFNVVPGYGGKAGAALSHHMDVDKISFTGSIPVGRLIQKASADSNFKNLTLEMGGKSPCVIFDDVDLDYAVMMSQVAIFSQGGQVCCSGARTFVHEAIYDEFVRKSVECAKRRKLGDPMDANVQQGPQINKEQQERILKMITNGLKNEGTLHCGGNTAPGLQGYFIQPTVITDLPDDNDLAKEEIFGPVQIIFKFRTMEELIRRCNKSAYGLAAGVFTRDINKAMTVANGVRAGTVWVNCFFALKPSTPFGGYKMSGIGRDLGEEALRSYTEVKTVVIKVPPTPFSNSC